MKRRPFPDDRPHDRRRAPRPRRRMRLLPLVLTIIGAVTVLVLVARHLIVPLLVYLGGGA